MTLPSYLYKEKNMIRKIKVIPDTFEDHILMVKEFDLTKMPDIRLIPIFGANGVGKSTLLKAIAGNSPRQFRRPGARAVELVTDKKTDCYSYIGSTDNFKVRQASTYRQAFDPMFLSMKLDARDLSEGQSIIYSLFDLLKGAAKAGGDFFDPEDDADKVILIDEMDSGLSIDNIDAAMRYVKRSLKNRTDTQFIISFNNPYLLHHFDTMLSMYDGNPVTLHDDKEMLAEIKRWKKQLDKLRKKSDGSFRII